MANYRPVQTETRKALDEIANKRKRGVNFGRPKPPEEFEASLREGGYYEPFSPDAGQDYYYMSQPGLADAPPGEGVKGSPYQGPWKSDYKQYVGMEDLPQSGSQIGPPVPPQYERSQPTFQRFHLPLDKGRYNKLVERATSGEDVSKESPFEPVTQNKKSAAYELMVMPPEESGIYPVPSVNPADFQ